MSTDSPTPAPVPPSNSIRVIKSDSFVEKAFLLVLTAALSGVMVPLIIKSVDTAREGQDAIARGQANLFDDISETIVNCETLMLDVTWFGTKHAKNAEMQKKAFERYSERSVDLIAKWRVQSSRAHALASPQVAKKLDAFQVRFFSEQDTPMNELWIKCGTDCDWQEQHSKNEAMLAESNMLIVELANDLGLARK